MLKRIAAAYNVTVDYLIGTEAKSDGRPVLTLSDLEYDLIVRFRELSPAERSLILRSVGIERGSSNE